jgi:NTE family protein
MRRNGSGVLLAALAFGVAGLLAAQASPPQTGEPGKRPKIGLALGGGGARGFAHIGVLRALEAMHIKVDYIAGTSMGSVVGSLYASGYSPDAMEKIVARIPWDTVFNDSPERKDLSFRNKEDDFRHLLPIQFGLTKKGLGLPSGLIAGNKLGFVLRSILLPSVAVTDFDHLRIPFRAVAADVQTGEPVVLATGDLARCVRASMAIPAAFTPVEIDGKLLIDGGEAQNLPVQAVRAMGADYVIAIDVGASGEASKKPEDVAQMLGAIIDIPLKQNTVTSRKLADLVIQPDLKGFSSADFDKFKEFYPRGQKATEQYAGELARLSAPAADFEAWRSAVQAPFPPYPVIDAVEVADVSSFDISRLKRLVRVQPGPLEPAKVAQDLKRIYALGVFTAVSYDVVREGGRWILRYNAVPKNWGPTFVRPGLGFESDGQSNTEFDLTFLVDATEMNRLGGRWKSVVDLGSNLGVSSIFYQPVEPTGTFSLAPSVGWGRHRAYIYAGDERLAEYLVSRFQGGLEAVGDFGTWGELRAGYNGGTGDGTRKVGDAAFPDVHVSFGAFEGQFIVDQLDNVNVPRSGYYGKVGFTGERTGLGATSSYDKLEGGILGVQTIGRWSGLLKFQGGDSLDTTLPYYDTFTLGGLFNLSGRPIGQLRGQTYLLGAAALYYRLNARSGLILKDLYVGVTAEVGNTWNRQQDVSLSDLENSGSIFFIANTLIGPVYVAWGRGSGGFNSFSVALNKPF